MISIRLQSPATDKAVLIRPHVCLKPLNTADSSVTATLELIVSTMIYLHSDNVLTLHHVRRIVRLAIVGGNIFYDMAKRGVSYLGSVSSKFAVYTIS